MKFIETVQKCPLEDNVHFLFICSKYNKLRLILLDFIQELIPKNNNADINIGLCLHGSIFKDIKAWRFCSM
jgi:hypothetical protein